MIPHVAYNPLSQHEINGIEVNLIIVCDLPVFYFEFISRFVEKKVFWFIHVMNAAKNPHRLIYGDFGLYLIYIYKKYGDLLYRTILRTFLGLEFV